MELAFEVFLGEISTVNSGLFQSFLSWNWLLKKNRFFGMQDQRPVSILLIVELAFEGEQFMADIAGGTSFNPSYRGIGF